MTARLELARRTSALLAELDDAGVRALVDAAETVGVGIGGTTRTAGIGGMTVFVKQLPLTRVEEADPTATSSRSDLPFVCHYGIGSPAHGVGRELAAHQWASGRVEAGAAEFFPLLLGWRIIDLPCASDLREFDGDAPRRRWGPFWPQVERRVAAMREATRSVVLFLEYVPETLGGLLRRSVADGSAGIVLGDAVEQLLEATAWMRDEGFQHFDVHPGNILVRDGRLLLTDFGLALHRGFELTPQERVLMAAHEGYDRDTALMHLFHWLLFELRHTSGPERLALLRAAAADPATTALDTVRGALGGSADLIADHAAVAVHITEMFAILMQDASGARYTPLPVTQTSGDAPPGAARL